MSGGSLETPRSLTLGGLKDGLLRKPSIVLKQINKC